MLDILIKNGKIVDGTGNPWFYGDIGIQGDIIFSIGHLKGLEAKKIIDATGLFISPGFIDIHSHSDLNILVNRFAESKIRQGVTTEVNGNCGFSAFTVDQKGKLYFGDALKINNIDQVIGGGWSDFDTYRQFLLEEGISINTATMIGHNCVRGAVMGEDNQAPTKDQLKKMISLVEKAYEQGVLGFSTGLVYLPGCFGQKDEIIELCKVFKGDGIYASHIRSLNDTFYEAIEEAVEIGERSDMPIQLSHIVPCPPQWYTANKLMKLINQYRDNGIDVTCDVFPYTYGGNILCNLCPRWATKDGLEKLVERLKDNEIRQKIIEDTRQYGAKSGGSSKRALLKEGKWDKIWLAECEKNKEFVSLNFTEIAALRKTDPFNAYFDILIEEEGHGRILGEDRCEEDLQELVKYPYSMIASDGRIHAPYGLLVKIGVHPRYYGTFPRTIAEYVRNKQIIGLEEAIRKMTSFPAARFNITRRGLLKEGYFADIVIFDYHKIQDLASIKEPHRYAQGINHVIVNGMLTIEQQKHLKTKNGRVITRR